MTRCAVYIYIYIYVSKCQFLSCLFGVDDGQVCFIRFPNVKVAPVFGVNLHCCLDFLGEN